jgi:hypothetical protein
MASAATRDSMCVGAAAAPERMAVVPKECGVARCTTRFAGCAEPLAACGVAHAVCEPRVHGPSSTAATSDARFSGRRAGRRAGLEPGVTIDASSPGGRTLPRRAARSDAAFTVVVTDATARPAVLPVARRISTACATAPQLSAGGSASRLTGTRGTAPSARPAQRARASTATSTASNAGAAFASTCCAASRTPSHRRASAGTARTALNVSARRGAARAARAARATAAAGLRVSVVFASAIARATCADRRGQAEDENQTSNKVRGQGGGSSHGDRVSTSEWAAGLPGEKAHA